MMDEERLTGQALFNIRRDIDMNWTSNKIGLHVEKIINITNNLNCCKYFFFFYTV